MCYDTRCKKEAAGMTIKKRLFCSNILMIAVPAAIVAFVGLLCMLLALGHDPGRRRPASGGRGRPDTYRTKYERSDPKLYGRHSGVVDQPGWGDWSH